MQVYGGLNSWPFKLLKLHLQFVVLSKAWNANVKRQNAKCYTVHLRTPSPPPPHCIELYDELLIIRRYFHLTKWHFLKFQVHSFMDWMTHAKPNETFFLSFFLEKPFWNYGKRCKIVFHLDCWLILQKICFWKRKCFNTIFTTIATSLAFWLANFPLAIRVQTTLLTLMYEKFVDILTTVMTRIIVDKSTDHNKPHSIY